MAHATARISARAVLAGILCLAACAEGSGDHAMRADAVNAAGGKDAAASPTSSGSVVVLDDAGPRVREDMDATVLDAGADAAVADGGASDAMALPMFASDGEVRAGAGGPAGSGGVGGGSGVGGIGGSSGVGGIGGSD